MKKVFYLVAASMLMTSCLKDRAIEAYNEEFASVFGDTDPLHTWKMVDEKTVEVNVEKPSRVKIYVKVDDTYRLAADYENVSGTRTLAFDAPMGCEDISVLVNGVSAQAVNARSGGQCVVDPVTDYLEITYGEMYNFHKNNSLPEKVDNRDKITTTGTNFESVGEGVYSFYPIYWGGTFKHSYGLYYYDENGVKQDCDPFYTNKEDVNALLYLNEETGKFEPVKTDYVKNLFSFPSGNVELEDAVSKKVIFKSPCFSIQVTPGTIFGFYVDTYYASGTFRGRFYTDPELNKENLSKDIFSSFAYLHNNAGTSSYISVEDYDDYDYNDFIFILEGEHEHYNEDPIKYMYAVEDLGGTHDFDFNDIVFTVSHVSGKENATVQPMAAGGIYPATIYFGDKSYGEIHGMFGVDENVMVNTKAGTTKSSMIKAEPFLVKVGATWSNTAVSYGNSGNGFSVKVEIPNRKDKVVTTYVPGEDAAPQMLVLAEDWLWPTEKTRISDAYSEFGVWGANYKNKTWVDTPNSSRVVNWR